MQEFIQRRLWHPCAFVVSSLTLLLVCASAEGSDWAQWRGVTWAGVSSETGLPSSWSPEGENLIWKQDFIGRSTPVVQGGRVFVTGRGGEEETRHEKLAAYDAETGRLVWQHTISTQLTTVPYNRAGWASPAVDPETGYVYAQGVGGPLVAYDRDGNLVWQRMLFEELGRFSGYGGRTASPLVDEDRVIVNVINTSWGELGPPRHRYYAFDKKNGDVLWVSTPGDAPEDLNTAGNGIVGVVGGRRLYIGGNADGSIVALSARTGELVWTFKLSKRGINSSPILIGDTVYVGHSEENQDEAELGRVVAIDATGTGDVTATHERWRRAITMGFPSPLYVNDRLYVLDNSANLWALDPKTGETIWEYELGTVGKSAPVWADGKIYVTEVNGRLHILEDQGSSAKRLDMDELTMPDGRYAETYGSPAVAYGRIYFTTEEGLYCLGDRERAFAVTASEEPKGASEARGSDQPSLALLVPGDATVGQGEEVTYQVRLYNETGRELERTTAAEWSLLDIPGEIANGRVTIEADTWFAAGHVVARVGALETRARLRAFADLPYEENFDDIAGKGRKHWIGGGRYQVSELDGQKVLEKPVAPSGLLRSNLFLGPPYLSDYTIQAEVMGGQQGRRRTDVGLINSGYFLDLLGNNQRLEMRSWSAVLRVADNLEFPWEMATWYVMKLRVEQREKDVLVQGKVWKKGEPEPESWTLTIEDPLGNHFGAPGVEGYSPASIYFDNVRIWKNR